MAKSNYVVLPGLENQYDQIKKIAVGGMAEVYRGRQKSLDRAVAIKRIRAEYRTNESIRRRFEREARSSANLLHQNLAHVYDFIRQGDDFYIIMEYIDGFDLAEIIHKSGALPLDVATIIAVQILRGLAHVHAHGMVHRDIKPDNIRVSTRGDIKIMDFGIAFDPGEDNITRPGVLIGSPHYLSPEQIIGDKPDFRSDVFSFGITFYEMLTGKRPFFESDGQSVYVKIQSGIYIPPEKFRPDLPGFYSKIIESCLQIRPDRRPSSTSRLASNLNEYLARNYSLAFEARIRQFLLEKEFLPGNPKLIEVYDRTYEGPRLPFLVRFTSSLDNFLNNIGFYRLLRILLFVVLLYGLYWSAKRLMVVYQNMHVEQPSFPEKTTPKRK